MKKTILTFCIVMVAIAVQAQHKKVKKASYKISYSSLSYPDSIGFQTQKDKIKCIAYSTFIGSEIQYIKADTILRTREYGYLYQYDSRIKRYTFSLSSPPIGFISGSGTSYYQNERFYFKGNEIFPIEILTAPKIK